MYINLNSIIPYICGVSCGFINIDNYELYIDYGKKEEYYNNPSFLELPYIDKLSYRDLKNKFLEKYIPNKKHHFIKMRDDEFEDYFHLALNNNLLVDDWYEYEDSFKIKLLQEWCDSNNIHYTLKKNI